MAMQLNAGEIGRADLFSILPENIVVNEADNGRAVPHSPEEIEALARSILTYGQQQPVVVRRVEDKKVALVSGYGRYKAVKHINRVLRPDSPVKLQCKVVDCNPEVPHDLPPALSRVGAAAAGRRVVRWPAQSVFANGPYNGV